MGLSCRGFIWAGLAGFEALGVGRPSSSTEDEDERERALGRDLRLSTFLGLEVLGGLGPSEGDGEGRKRGRSSCTSLDAVSMGGDSMGASSIAFGAWSL